MFNREKGRDFDYAGWVILEGNSPIRQDFDSRFQELVYQPKTNESSLLELSKATLNNLEFIKPEYSSEYWLSEKSNHLILKNLIESVGRFFTNIQLFQRNDDKTIFLEFQREEKEYIVVFPIDFPKTNLIIVDKKENKIIEGVNWEFKGDILESSLNYIKTSLHVKDTFLSRILNIK
jgi:hypothetical protein